MLDSIASVSLAAGGTFVTLALLQKTGLASALAFIAVQAAFAILFSRRGR